MEIYRVPPSGYLTAYRAVKPKDALPYDLVSVEELKERVTMLNFCVAVSEREAESLRTRMEGEIQETVFELFASGKLAAFLEALRHSYKQWEDEGARRLRAERSADNMAYMARQTARGLKEAWRREEGRRKMRRARAGD